MPRIMLESLLACPVCHGVLGAATADALACERCGRTYLRTDGAYDFTPSPLPDEALSRRWAAWCEVQEHGAVYYERAPSDNLSVGRRPDARAFGRFADLAGIVLDVGCGPQASPSYASSVRGELVGIDPLRGVQPRRFRFVQGVGEYLPFRDGTFDRVLFATSLDHMLAPARAIAEARRVVRRDGTVCIWHGETTAPAEPANAVRRLARILGRGDFRALGTAIRARLDRRRRALPAFTAPADAADPFHLEHLDRSAIEALVRESGLELVESIPYKGTSSWFLRAVPVGE
jgi:SAM-dependent methyltransferase